MIINRLFDPWAHSLNPSNIHHQSEGSDGFDEPKLSDIKCWKQEYQWQDVILILGLLLLIQFVDQFYANYREKG